MSTILSLLTDRALERVSQWTPTFLAEAPDVLTLEETALLGSHSYCLPGSRRRLIWNTIVLEGEVKETPSAIARDYLTLEYKRGPIGSKGQTSVTSLIPAVPNVALPAEYSHGVYIDIKSCYWSIMQVIGWNVDYFPGRWLSPGRPPENFPFLSHKVARNCLVSAGRLGVVSRYIPHGQIDEIKIGNRLANTQLPRLISDVLNSIASQAVELGAIYCNNDGFIAPDLKIAKNIIQIIFDWGLTPTIKGEGAGSVKSSGAYRTGPYKSLPWEMRQDKQAIKILFPPPYRKWLQDRFSHFAA